MICSFINDYFRFFENSVEKHEDKDLLKYL